MLAWVHQATASEHEFLDQLFGVKDSKRMVGSARNLTGWEEMARECLDRDLEGVCRPLKVRDKLSLLIGRYGYSTRSSHKKGSSWPSRLPIYCSFTWSRCARQSEKERCCHRLWQSKFIGKFVSSRYRIHTLANTAFFETLDAQGRSLLRFLHVSHQYSRIGLIEAARRLAGTTPRSPRYRSDPTRDHRSVRLIAGR